MIQGTFRPLVRAGLSGREREAEGRALICGNHVNLGCESSVRAADGLRLVFFNAPVPLGCTFTDVLSSEQTSTLIAMICMASKTRSRRVCGR